MAEWIKLVFPLELPLICPTLCFKEIKLSAKMRVQISRTLS